MINSFNFNTPLEPFDIKDFTLKIINFKNIIIKNYNYNNIIIASVIILNNNIIFYINDKYKYRGIEKQICNDIYL